MAKKETAMVLWEKEMAEEAKRAAAVVAGIGGGVQTFSIRGARLKLGDVEIPGNKVLVRVLDQVLVNTFYEGKFDPDNKSSPTCYAFSRGEELVPFAAVEHKQAEKCAACPKNAFGSADNGKGKACQNRMRLYVLKAGEGKEIYDAEQLKTAEVAVFNIPPTSLNAWSKYVKQIVGLGLTPYMAVTELAVLPDDKVQVRVVPTLVAHKSTKEDYELLRPRAEEQGKEQFQAFPKNEELTPTKKKTKKARY